MKYYFLFIFLFSGKLLTAQSFQIGGLEDQSLRLMQLQGKLGTEYSFSSRPYSSGDSLTYTSIHHWLDGKWEESSWKKQDKKNKFQPSYSLLPVVLKTQFNSHHPFGWNDGAMIPAKGFQTMLSAGVYAKAGPLTIQLQPELVFAANPNFEIGNAYGANTYGNYKKIFPGQSSIRLNIGNFSAGASTENIWWGPGTQSALLMSNNAPGFFHMTFNSIRPVKTAIGSFEWQLIGGKLLQDSMLLSQVTDMRTANVPFPQSGDWLYLNGLSITWQPKWIKGLSLGVNRVFQLYSQDLRLPPVNILDDYLPVFGTLFKKSISSTDDNKKREQIVSLNLRWVFPIYHFEFYTEYGRTDHSYNLRDFLMTPIHASTYVFGIKKMVPLQENKFLMIESEVTHMQESADRLVRPSGNWYEHYQVTAGYTNQYQILGAGSGFGNNVQSLLLSYHHKWTKLGVKMEIIQNNPIKSIYKWTDKHLGLQGRIKHKNILLNLDAGFVFSKNYGFIDNASRFNFRGMMEIRYQL